MIKDKYYEVVAIANRVAIRVFDDVKKESFVVATDNLALEDIILDF